MKLVQTIQQIQCCYQAMKRAIVVGAGVAGLGMAIRLAAKGYKVAIHEKNSYSGGKMSQIEMDGFRFDSGPSLFTFPEYVEALFQISGKKVEDYISWQRLDVLCNYFFEDGTMIRAYSDVDRFADEANEKTGEPKRNIQKYFSKCKTQYDLTGELFIRNSFHKRKTFRSPEFRKALKKGWKLDPLRTMHRANSNYFKDKRLVKIFDRFATYNGSNPYRVPATLNVIPHIEHQLGAYFPEKGMIHIVEALVRLAKDVGVEINYENQVDEILIQGNSAVGIRTEYGVHEADYVVTDVDIHLVYKQLLTDLKPPARLFRHEKSTSALIFYWAMDREFPQMDLHNIFFAEEYQEEFEALFDTKSFYSDPTVYVFVSKRLVPNDAPEGKENWFVMINVPENVGQDWLNFTRLARMFVISKLERMLGEEISGSIMNEHVVNPVTLEIETAAYHGSLYGNSSNGIFAAFNRHPNFHKKVENLFFTGGSVHPGGGIPLCLASAEIVDRWIPHAKVQP